MINIDENNSVIFFLRIEWWGVKCVFKKPENNNTPRRVKQIKRDMRHSEQKDSSLKYW